jgi:hypothetical protein
MFVRSIGSKETVARRLRRQQRGIQPRDPATVKDIDLPPQYCTTGVPGEEFLIADTGKDDPRRMLVFGSSEQLRQLVISDT